MSWCVRIFHLFLVGWLGFGLALPAAAAYIDPASSPTATGLRGSGVSQAPAGGPKEIVFIDAAVQDAQVLAAGVRPGLEVVRLGAGDDGVNRISAVLADRRGLKAIHIVSHGAPGRVFLGTGLLSAERLEKYDPQLKVIGRSLQKGGNIMFYGCSVARGSLGKQFIADLATATGAAVAASTDTTGSAGHHGNWVLEQQNGAIDTAVAFTAQAQATYAHVLGTFDFSSFISGQQTVDGVTVTVTTDSTGSNSSDTLSASSGYVIDSSNSGTNIQFSFNQAVDVSSFKVGFSSNSGSVSAFTIQGFNGATTYTYPTTPGYSDLYSGGAPTYTVTPSGWGPVTSIKVTCGGPGKVTFTADTIVFTVADIAPTLSATGGTPTFVQGSAAGADLFSGVTANTNNVPQSQTFTGATLTITNVADTTEYLTIGGTDVPLTAGTGTIGSKGNYAVSLSGGTATVTLTNLGRDNGGMADLVNEIKYKNTSAAVTTGNRVVTLVNVTDSGSTNNSTTVNRQATVTLSTGIVTSAVYTFDANASGSDFADGTITGYDTGGTTGNLINYTMGGHRSPLQITLTPSDSKAGSSQNLIADVWRDGGDALTADPYNATMPTAITFAYSGSTTFDFQSITIGNNGSGGPLTLTFTTDKGVWTASSELGSYQNGDANFSNTYNIGEELASGTFSGVKWVKITAASGDLDFNINTVVIKNITPQLPTVTSLSATSGPASGGTSVIIAGTNFNGVTGVTFGATASSFTVNSATQITATAPVHSPGTVNVAVATADGASATSAASQFTYDKLGQAITFANPGARNFGTTPTLTATADSNLAPTFTSATTGVCTITAGGALTFVATGTCTINADQAGDSTYTAAATVAQSFAVNAVAPGAPTGVAAVVSDGQATVTFSAPASNGGTAITGYTVTASPAGGTDTNAGTTGLSHVVTGLTNGTAYTFTVTATNGVGTGAASAASTSATPKGSQTITFANPGSQTFGTTLTLNATTNATGQTVTFSSTTTGVCTVSGTTATFVTTGMCTIKADAAATSSYQAAPTITQSFAVNAVVPGAPTIGTVSASGGAASVAFTAPAFTGGAAITGYTVTASPGGATGTGTASPITVTGLTNGTAYTFTVSATNSVGTGSASAASTSATPKGSQAITFDQPANQNFGTTLTLNATTNAAGGTVTFSSTTAGVCTVSGTTATFVTAGMCTIKADAAATSSYQAAPTITQSFTVNAVVPGAPTIGTVSASGGTASVAFTAPAFTGGAAITGYTVTASPGGVTGTGSASPITVTGLTNGTAYTFTVSATNSAGTGSASTASASATPKGSQAITFNQPSAQNFGTTPTLTATTTATGLTPTFTSSTTPVCTITTGGTLTFVTAGTCTINADQAGNSTYSAAPTITKSFTVNAVVPGTPTIGTVTASGGAASVAFTAPAFTGGANITGYTVTASPGGATATGTASPITITGLTNGTAYTFTVTATNSAGTGSASAASNSVTPKVVQTIGAISLTPATLTVGGTATAAATATSGLAVTFTSQTPSVCTVTGVTVTAVTGGTCTIAANQGGNTTYGAAPQATQTITINKISQTIAFPSLTDRKLGDGDVDLGAAATSGLTVSYASSNTAVASVVNGKIRIVGVGTCTITASQAGDITYLAAEPVGRSLTVAYNGAPPVMTVSALSDGAATTETTQNVSGIVTDVNGIASLTINGMAVQIAANGSFSYPVQLLAGTNTIAVVATSNAGLASTDTRTVTLNTTGLQLAVAYPPDNKAVIQQSITVTGNISELLSNNVKTTAKAAAAAVDPTLAITYTVNGGTSQTASLTDTTYSFTANLDNGMNTIQVMAANSAGLKVQAKRTVTYQTGFSLAITDPTADLRTEQGSYLLKGTVADNSTPVTVAIVMDGQTYTPAVDATTGAFQQELPLDSYKVYQVGITGTDQGNNSLTVQRNIIHAAASSSFTVSDALTALQATVGKITPSSTQIQHLDVAPMVSGVSVGDGKVDIEDVIVILRMATGLL